MDVNRYEPTALPHQGQKHGRVQDHRHNGIVLEDPGDAQRATGGTNRGDETHVHVQDTVNLMSKSRPVISPQQGFSPQGDAQSRSQAVGREVPLGFEHARPTHKQIQDQDPQVCNGMGDPGTNQDADHPKDGRIKDGLGRDPEDEGRALRDVLHQELLQEFMQCVTTRRGVGSISILRLDPCSGRSCNQPAHADHRQS
mmetsp:Transcript_16105/g.17375  ORF Transcript_16105/g.17375 Transcript_16105/m.17375 type:complete len:198 (+) Transcript_16105:554-1147(+)